LQRGATADEKLLLGDLNLLCDGAVLLCGGGGGNNAVNSPHFPSEILDYGEITLFYLISCHKM